MVSQLFKMWQREVIWRDDTVISSKIGSNLLGYWLRYIIPRAIPRSLLLTANRSSTVTSMETPVFNPYYRTTTPFRHTRCFSFPRLFFSVYLIPSPITSTIPIVVNLSETFGKLAVIAGRWAGPYELDERREESERRRKRRRTEEKRKRRGGEFESDCIRRRVVRERVAQGATPRWVLQGCRVVS